LPQPVEWRPASIIESLPAGAVFEQDLDRLDEPGLRNVMQRGRPVVALVDVGTATQERGDERGVILATLVAGAADSDPISGLLARDADPGRGPGGGQPRRDLGVEHPSPGPDSTRIRAVLEQELDHVSIAPGSGGPEGARSGSDGFGAVIEQDSQGGQLTAADGVVDRRDGEHVGGGISDLRQGGPLGQQLPEERQVTQESSGEDVRLGALAKQVRAHRRTAGQTRRTQRGDEEDELEAGADETDVQRSGSVHVYPAADEPLDDVAPAGQRGVLKHPGRERWAL
jgi:hypothetical protein